MVNAGSRIECTTRIGERDIPRPDDRIAIADALHARRVRSATRTIGQAWQTPRQDDAVPKRDSGAADSTVIPPGSCGCKLFVPSFKVALVLTTVASFAAATSGHEQAQHTAKAQPMKLAAMEALWETEQPASFSLFSAINQDEKTSSREIKLPVLLSVLANNNTTGEVKGLNELQRAAEAKYGPGDYLPPVALTYWSFRAMVGLGLLFIALSLYGLWLWWRGKLESAKLFLRLLTVAVIARISVKPLSASRLAALARFVADRPERARSATSAALAGQFESCRGDY